MAQKLRPPVEKNDDLVVTIESLTNEGQGVARVEGFAVFVVGALAGEEVKAHVIKVQPTYAVAKATEILKPSPDRVRPACPVFAQCGGCTLWHLSYPAQLRQKQQWVQDALSRLIESMTRQSVWCPDAPIGAAGWQGKLYRKD